MIESRCFEEELRSIINRWSKENGSDTPDFILASYLLACLDAFDASIRSRDVWHGNKGLWEKLGLKKPDTEPSTRTHGDEK